MKQNAPSLILFGVISILLFSPFFFGDTIFADGDAFNYFYPYSFFYNQFDGQWNSLISGGMSVVSTFQFGYFNPIYKLFFNLFDFLNGYHLILLVNLFLSLVFSYFFALSLKLNKAQAALVAIIYGLSFHNLSSISAITFTNITWILPALFLLVDKVISGRNIYFFLITLIVGFGFLSSHYQFLAFAVLSSIFYLGFRAYFEVGKKRLLFLFSSLFASLVGAILIGLPQILNIYEFTKLSIRSSGNGFINTVADGIMPIDLFSYIFTSLSLPQGWSNGFLGYVGLIGLVLAIIGIKNFKLGSKQRKFFTGGFIFLLLSSFKYSPLYLLIYSIPPMMFFRGSARIIFIAVFFIAILAGYGARDLVSNFERNKKIFLRLLMSIGLFVTTVATVASLGGYFKNSILPYINRYFDANLYLQTTKQPLEYYHSLIEKIYDGLIATFSFSNPIILITISLCFVIYFIVKKELVKKEHLVTVFIIGSLINLLPLFYTSNHFTDKKLIDQEPISAGIIKDIGQAKNDYRTASFLFPFVGFKEITALNPTDVYSSYEFFKEGMVPNLNILYGISTLNGVEPMKLTKRENLFKEIFIDEKKISINQKLQEIEEKVPLLSLLNVRFLIIPFSLSGKNLNLISEYKVTKYNLPIYIYENKNFLPKIYIPQRPKCFIDENKLFASIVSSTYPDGQDAYILYDDCEIFNKDLATAKIDKFLIEENDNGITKIITKSDRPFWLVFSESNLPGWRVSIDTQITKVYNANYLFQAVNVPAGEHIVEFRYDKSIRSFFSK